MRLYTISTRGRPMIVMSAAVEPMLTPDLAGDPEVVKAFRAQKTTDAAMAQFSWFDPDDVARDMEQQEIEEALNTWLGRDLKRLLRDGQPLWNGDRAQLAMREATAEEAARWQASIAAAHAAGEQADWIYTWHAFLVPVTDHRFALSPPRRD